MPLFGDAPRHLFRDLFSPSTPVCEIYFRLMLTQAEADFLHTLEKEFESGELLPRQSRHHPGDSNRAMTPAECKILIGNYVSWLNEELRVEALEGSCVISTPFLDRHNDEIEVYVEKRDDGQYFLTDDGYTLSDLRHCGVALDTAKREAHLEKILNGFGVRLSGDELHIHTSARDFPSTQAQPHPSDFDYQ